MPEWFLVGVLIVSFFAGATASVVGFGIGSLLTPLVALRLGTDTAIAAVALPHLLGGLIRFGLLSAAAGSPAPSCSPGWKKVGSA